MNQTQTSAILPPATLGILGGGQLGRMFALAAQTMGYRVMVLDPDPHAPAAAFADVHLCAPYDDSSALETLASCAAVTTEFENVNADSMLWLSQYTRVSPSGRCVAIAQDREQEKAWIRKAGLTTAPYRIIASAQDAGADSNAWLPGILKTATLGYDGKGQVRVSNPAELAQAYADLGGVRCVLEKMLDLRSEISVIVCRLDSAHTACFAPIENQHQNGILAYSLVPARLPERVQQQAQAVAQRLADTLDYVGVLAVELFVVGDDAQLVVNEMAPRPHNSGHHTLDACASSQFQQQIRLMCGLPPADITLLSPCCMANILGNVWPGRGEPDWAAILQHPKAHLHLYGKHEARPGRKMGHFTQLAEHTDAAFALAQAHHAALSTAENTPCP